MSENQENLIKAVIAAQNDAVRDYVRMSTYFDIGYPEEGNKLHIMVRDIKTKEIIKKINIARFLLSNLTDELVSLFESAIVKHKESNP